MTNTHTFKFFFLATGQVCGNIILVVPVVLAVRAVVQGVVLVGFWPACVTTHTGLRAPGSVVVTELPVVASFVATENSLSQQRFSPPWPNCVATSNPVTTSEPPAVCGPCRDTEPEGYVKT